MTTGVRAPAAKWSISCMRAMPWEEVAVKTRAPASEAAMQAAMAECSLSTVIISPVSSPVWANSRSFSSTGVWGVMG